MSLKPVELQVALPRTKDAGMLQGQLLQKPVQDQEQLAQDANRRLEEQRKRSEKTEAESEVQNRKEDSSSQGRSGERSRHSNKQQSKKRDVTIHPYKGRHIDLSL